MTIRVNGELVDDLPVQLGYARLHRMWSSGDVIELQLPMPIRLVRSHEKVEANCGRVAIQRGPMVYCIEAMDSDAPLDQIFVPVDVALTAAHRPDSGTVEVWLDGESRGVWDTYSEEDPANPWSTKLDEAVWHQFGLADGVHTLKVQVLGQPYTRADVTSGGTIFSMMDVVVFHQGPSR